MIHKVAKAIFKMLSVVSSRVRLMKCKLLNQGITIDQGVNFAPRCFVHTSMNGKINIGQSAALCNSAHLICKHGSLIIGNNTEVGHFSLITAREHISIGDDCLIAEHVTIRDQDHVAIAGQKIRESGFATAPIIIGNNVWIGAKATITKGVTIGDNSVIGAGAVVTSNIPANSVAVGVPAKVIKKIDGA